ncbi:MAG TPA: Xaa-Pro dipeptidyl-peptidase, partial [Streptomyces sp.]|nr:Xaa-Pro dipeptidyl-peptidase [Streptomyces sp.]
DLIDPPAGTPTLTIDLRKTSAKVPLVGGAAAFERATTGATATPGTTVLDGVGDPGRAARVPGGTA